MPCAIGIDLGGTRIKAGAIDGEARVLVRRTVATEADQGPDEVIQRMCAVSRELCDELGGAAGLPAAIGIGAPGALNRRAGVIISPPNLPGWRNVPLVERVQQGAGLPVILENDANAAAWGEYVAGAGHHTHDAVMLTLGTGVGGGVISDGKLCRGHFETGGEIGHMIVQPEGRLCNCGQSGCLEAYASASNVARRVVEAIRAGERSICDEWLRKNGALEAHDVVAAAAAGDAVAHRVWGDACRYLAVACVNIQHMINPAVIIFAGGMSAAGDQLLAPVREHFERLTWPGIDDRPELRIARLGNDAGWIGAASLALATVTPTRARQF